MHFFHCCKLLCTVRMSQMHKTHVFMKHNITFIVGFFNVGAVCVLCFHFHPNTVFFLFIKIRNSVNVMLHNILDKVIVQLTENTTNVFVIYSLPSLYCLSLFTIKDQSPNYQKSCSLFLNFSLNILRTLLVSKI